MFRELLLVLQFQIGGGTQIRTGDKGFAVLCLTTWLCRHKGQYINLISLCQGLKTPQLLADAGFSTIQNSFYIISAWKAALSRDMNPQTTISFCQERQSESHIDIELCHSFMGQIVFVFSPVMANKRRLKYEKEFTGYSRFYGAKRAPLQPSFDKIGA